MQLPKTNLPLNQVFQSVKLQNWTMLMTWDDLSTISGDSLLGTCPCRFQSSCMGVGRGKVDYLSHEFCRALTIPTMLQTWQQESIAKFQLQARLGRKAPRWYGAAFHGKCCLPSDSQMQLLPCSGYVFQVTEGSLTKTKKCDNLCASRKWEGSAFLHPTRMFYRLEGTVPIWHCTYMSLLLLSLYCYKLGTGPEIWILKSLGTIYFILDAQSCKCLVSPPRQPLPGHLTSIKNHEAWIRL